MARSKFLVTALAAVSLWAPGASAGVLETRGEERPLGTCLCEKLGG